MSGAATGPMPDHTIGLTLFCRHFVRELLKPVEPTRVRVYLTHANAHAIHASDTPLAREVRAKFPLEGVETEEVVNPTDPDDRTTVEVKKDWSARRIPWDVALRPTKKRK